MSSISKHISGKPKLVAIVGPTASGKTELGIRVAKLLGGEIVCVDSRTVYRFLDIGTAKPTAEERKLVRHWGLDLVGPGDPIYTVADFQLYASQRITDILSRQKIPVLVGGSGLYMDAVLYGFSLAPSNSRLRQQLEDLSIDELQMLLIERNLPMPENSRNRRYLVRALERGNQQLGQRPLPKDWLVVGIDLRTDVLKQRIAQRFDGMLARGVIAETHRISALYGHTVNAANTGIYKILRRHLAGEVSIDDAKTLFLRSDWRLAKRQRTWFHRHDADINWFEDADSAYSWIAAMKSVH